MMPIKSKPIPSAGYVYPVTFEHSTMDNWYQTEKAEQGFKYATSLVKPILTFLGVWPLPPDSHLSSKIIQKIAQFVAYFLFFFMLTPTFLYTVLKEKNPKVKMKLLGPLVLCGMQVPKYTILLYRSKEIQESLKAIKRDWIAATEENRLIFLEKAKTGRSIVLTVAITIYGGGLCYRTIIPLLKGPITLPDNTTIRPLPLPSYYVIFDAQQSPNYEIIFVMQVLSGSILYSAITGTCGISAILVLHICSLLRILANKMKQLAENDDMTEREVQRRITDIVNYQTSIKQFSYNIQKITEYICLSEILGGTTMMCLGGYYILLELDNNNTTIMVVYLTLEISCTFCVFILCYIGQLLLNESQIVGQASCTVNWYRLPMKHARSLILLIVVSNYPMRLTAGKMVEMSLGTFTSICKLSMGYLNILREVV
ncbi:odorant receptor 4-like isoform X2 [Ceratina calcarata]|uniref:Odorant receptor n=1 Tax=Ceratina calcarata TaxID=156304 RepID=A0AAJ7IWI0_9HYME|nr:odorant receptor 4-like isoform X2 [Ceratina calcarata]